MKLVAEEPPEGDADAVPGVGVPEHGKVELPVTATFCVVAPVLLHVMFPVNVPVVAGAIKRTCIGVLM